MFGGDRWFSGDRRAHQSFPVRAQWTGAALTQTRGDGRYATASNFRASRHTLDLTAARAFSPRFVLPPAPAKRKPYAAPVLQLSLRPSHFSGAIWLYVWCVALCVQHWGSSGSPMTQVRGGNLGESGQPHLHIHAQMPDPPDAPFGVVPVPMPLGASLWCR
jgi:hypothetical protein